MSKTKIRIEKLKRKKNKKEVIHQEDSSLKENENLTEFKIQNERRIP